MAGDGVAGRVLLMHVPEDGALQRGEGQQADEGDRQRDRKPAGQQVDCLGPRVQQRDADQRTAGEAHRQVQALAPARHRRPAEQARPDGGEGKDERQHGGDRTTDKMSLVYA